ncbi:polymer-forming cytoskeletal protein [Omnitrophica bacterium]|nr:polymer-forming cytoskeletal protein [Candidatus Omnitrophota bacterium]
MRKKESTEKILDVDASMQGSMVFKDPVNLRINGTFEGGLDTKGILTIGENAVVKANIKGEVVTVAGSVYGDIEATRSVNIIPPARVIGNIRSPILSITEGAVFEGNSHMLKGKETRTVSAKDLLSIEEVARYLEVDKSLILSWASEGKLPGVKEKDTWRFERTRLDDWIANEKIR